jgi:FKBP-type peptidyl-prolyl cis-trans isomerase FkpA
MKSFVLFLSVLAIFYTQSGCAKQEKACTPEPVQNEEAKIEAYASANGINVTKHSSGLYYEVVNAGSGARPAITSKVTVNYTGKLTNGVVFDKSDGNARTWVLGLLIPSWQIALPLIQKGGKIKIISPSALSYGCESTDPIPGNSVLYFEIDLLDVQ